MITVRKRGILLVRVFVVPNDESHGIKYKLETIERVDYEDSRSTWQSVLIGEATGLGRGIQPKNVQKFSKLNYSVQLLFMARTSVVGDKQCLATHKVFQCVIPVIEVTDWFFFDFVRHTTVFDLKFHIVFLESVFEFPLSF